MNSTQMLELGKMLAIQAGIDEEKLSLSIEFWKPNLMSIDFEKATESIKVLMLNDSVKNKEAGKWLGAIVRYCAGVVTEKHKPENPKVAGCHDCQNSGMIEVPHRNDWNEGKWNGQYTMVVACECGLGQMKACQGMNIKQYESLFPQWRLEYPLRRHDWQLRMILSRPMPGNVKDQKKRTGRIAELQALLGEVA